MDELWGVLAALAALAVPMALAAWLLGRPERRRGLRHDARGKMPDKKDD